MPAYYFRHLPTAAERVHANARRLIRECGAQAVDVAESRADAARQRGDFAGLRLWRRTARSAAALLPERR